MKKITLFALLLALGGWAAAQQGPKDPASAPASAAPDNAKLAAFKKKLSDGIDTRIGRLEELEECIQAAPDLAAIKACRAQQAADAAQDRN